MGWEKIILVVLLTAGISAVAFGAEIRGGVYELPSLDKLSDVVVEINTVPNQRMVANNGEYFFEGVPKGNYIISAKYYENNELKYTTEEEVVVEGDGIFNIDLIMIPNLEGIEDTLEDVDVGVDENVVEDVLSDEPKDGYILLLVVILVVLGVVGLIYFKMKNKKHDEEKKDMVEHKKDTSETKKEDVEYRKDTSETKKEDVEYRKDASETKKDDAKLDSFALQAIQLLKKQNNRMTQKELIDKMGLSDAKISLLVDELVSEGKIKKIKKGRANVLVLIEN